MEERETREETHTQREAREIQNPERERERRESFGCAFYYYIPENNLFWLPFNNQVLRRRLVLIEMRAGDLPAETDKEQLRVTKTNQQPFLSQHHSSNSNSNQPKTKGRRSTSLESDRSAHS